MYQTNSVTLLHTSMSSVVQPHILAIDDDSITRQVISDYLLENDFRVTTVATGAEMSQTFAQHAVDLVILDLRLAGEDGMQLARQLRDKGEIPIIVVSGKRDEADRVMALELGADDYITKPFSPRELLARIRTVLRRYQTARKALPPHSEKVRAYRFDGWEVNVGTRRLKGPEGRSVEITRGEFSLLQAFCSAPQRVLSRDQLLDLTRLHGAEIFDRSIDVAILRLRRRIEADAGQPRYIKTERGAGYIFDARVEVLR